MMWGYPFDLGNLHIINTFKMNIIHTKPLNLAHV